MKMDLREIGIDGGELDSAGSGYGLLGGFCKHGDGTSGSIKKASYCLTS
jgi:hypothetical protein